jgi:hypothetical protein
LAIIINNVLAQSNDNDSSDNSMKHTNIYVGYNKNDNDPNLILPSAYFINFSYKIINFYSSIESQTTQIGLANEFGFNNLSIYYDISPEFRVIRKFYLDPHLGLSLVLTNYGVGFLPYAGLKFGVVLYNIDNIDIQFEMGINTILTDTKILNRYFKLGVSFDFFNN